MATLTARFAFDAPTTILAATLVLLPLRAFAQSEAPAAADTAAPAQEAPKAEVPAEAAKPAEAPKCECPPPCPPPPAPPPPPPAEADEWKAQSKGGKAFKDTRVNAKVGLTTNLWKQLSFGFSFVLKYDQNPAARPVPKGAPPDTAYPSTYVSWAYADKVDTVTEATFIYTFF
jgi:hypothetical protein